MRLIPSSTLYLMLLCFFSNQAFALVETSIEADSQLKGWKLTKDALSLELIQRLPDQTRAFFQARGFSKSVANNIATQCVLQTIGKNISSNSQSISYDLHDWVIKIGASINSIKFKEIWDEEWNQSDVNISSRIAFRWATFPTQQNFEPGGDFNWGMISFGLPPQTIFDLKVVWKQDGETQHEWIRKVECPEDR